MTADLDRVVESREPLESVERFVADQQNWLERAALELHRCRRYYERPESQLPYQASPTPGATVTRSGRPNPNSTSAAQWPATIQPCCVTSDS